MRNEARKGAGWELTCKQAGSVHFEPYTWVATGSLVFREANLCWQTTFFVPAKLFC